MKYRHDIGFVSLNEEDLNKFHFSIGNWQLLPIRGVVCVLSQFEIREVSGGSLLVFRRDLNAD